MKKRSTFLTLIILTLLAVGCDAPQRGRTPTNWVTDNNSSSGSENFSQTGPGLLPNEGGQSSAASTTGCDLTQKYHTVDTGHFGLCQNPQNESLFQLNPSLTSTLKTCLIPTYKNPSGSSTYIGNPQCTATTANQVVTGTLYKDRPGFSSYAINGVIVMKESLLPEYFKCMQAYVNWPANVCPTGASNPYCANWLPLCPAGGKSSSTCHQEAQRYMSVVCNEFKNRYSNSYADIGL